VVVVHLQHVKYFGFTLSFANHRGWLVRYKLSELLIARTAQMRLITTLVLAAVVTALPQSTQTLGACADNILVIARGSTEPGNVVGISHLR
jgi:hypothetical protein